MVRLILGGAAFAVFSIAAAIDAQELPDGNGKALLQTACTQCHAADTFAGQRHTRDEWTEVVSRMVGNGAQLSDDEFKLAVDYLATHLGPTGRPAGAAPVSVRSLPEGYREKAN